MLSTVLGILLSIFSPPVDYPISLAGNFGEPRPNHFHGGLDVKTDGVEGKHIYSIADGYVSRVTVGLYGFGNAVYITHPSGQTSVYCHLKSFSPRIKAALRRYQYTHETCVADARFSPLDVPVSQGQFIALSGNTGHSTAPHLHLEMHDTRTWDMLDPYHYLSEFINDTVPPRAHGFMACPTDAGSSFNGGRGKQVFGFPSHQLSRSFTAWGRIGFALYADDYMQESYNHYGVRQTILMVDGREVFHSDIDRIPVELTRLVNSWGDYDYWLHHRVWYMRSFVEPGNGLPILHADEQRGVIDFSEERDYHLEYILRDYKGNESHYSFVVTGKPYPAPTAGNVGTQGEGPVFHWNQTNTYSQPGMQLVVPYGSLARDFCLRPSVKECNQLNAFSDMYCFHDCSLPLITDGKVSIYVQCPVEDSSKLYVTSSGKFMGGDYNDGWVTGRLRELGEWYELAYDDKAPRINPISLGERIVLSSYDAESGIASWTASIDGRFVVFDAIEKSSSFVCDLRETWLPKTGKSHQLVFSVTDNRNNTQTYETTITY